MIEVFKTTVQNKTQEKKILNSLKTVLSKAKINFNGNDCDKILRIEGINEWSAQTVAAHLKNLGFHCEILL